MLSSLNYASCSELTGAVFSSFALAGGGIQQSRCVEITSDTARNRAVKFLHRITGRPDDQEPHLVSIVARPLVASRRLSWRCGCLELLSC